MAEYLTSRLLEYRQSADPEVWIDITAYLVSDVTCEYGLPGEGPTDRLADTGTCDFSLSNISGIFTPGLSGSLVGFGRGSKVRYSVSWANETWVKFYGSILDLRTDSKDYGERLAVISCGDFMNNANTFPLKGMTIQTNKTAAEGVAAIAALMPTPPLDTRYDAGGDTFPTIFDSVSPRAKAASEFNKLIMSELGYVYRQSDRMSGEKLVVESRLTRDKSPLTGLPLLVQNAGYLLLQAEMLIDGDLENWSDASTLTNWTKVGTLAREAVNKYSGVYSAKITSAAPFGSYIYQLSALQAGATYTISGWVNGGTGGGTFWILDNAYAVKFEHVTAAGVTEYFEEEYVAVGDEWMFLPICTAVGYVYYDAVSVRRAYDGGKRILEQGGYKKLHQSTPYAFNNNMVDVDIVNGEYIVNDATVRVYPRKVDTGALATLFTLNTPIDIGAGDTITVRGGYTDATTKKPVNATGFTDIATNVTYTLSAGSVIITGGVYSDSFMLTIYNPGAALQLLTMTIKGHAIHLDEPIESNVQDADSIEKYDYCSVNLDQPYQDDLASGLTLAYTAIHRGARPRSVAKRIINIANQDENLMSAWLNMDIGSAIKVSEDRNQINSTYYISRIGWTVTLAGIVNYWFEIQEALSFSSVFWQVGTAGRTEVGNLIVGI